MEVSVLFANVLDLLSDTFRKVNIYILLDFELFQS